MARIIAQYLFSWEDVDASSDLFRLRLVLDNLPDEPVVRALETHRGNGRDDYPVRALWNAVIAGIVFQHPTIEALLRELRRNAELRQVCGFNPIHGAKAVPPAWAMSRFLSNLVDAGGAIHSMFDEAVSTLCTQLPDFGEKLAFDGKAIPSYSTGSKDSTTDATSDPDADWGTKSYRGVNANGKAWDKTKRWFGYQLHLIVDSNHELPVAFEVMRASTSEVTRLLPMVERLTQVHPTVVDRCTVLTADRGLDSGPVNTVLWEDHQIKPVIDCRRLWKEEKAEQGYDPEKEITRALDPKIVDTIVYTERGDLRCVCPISGAENAMAFWGFEADRLTLKYRCPAAVRDFRCPGRAACEQGARASVGNYGRVVRVPLDTDRRIFTPIPRESPQWKREYSARTSVERVNARVDQGFGFERHTIRGLAKMQTRMGLALTVMLAVAIGFIRQGKPEMIRSLVGSPRPRRPAA
ncbi:MAG: transposase [Planctomycetota bacterium]